MPDDFLEIGLGLEVFSNDSCCECTNTPSGCCKLENSFLHGLILSTTEVGFFI